MPPLAFHLGMGTASVIGGYTTWVLYEIDELLFNQILAVNKAFFNIFFSTHLKKYFYGVFVVVAIH